MLLHDFHDRAEEYLRLAERATSEHDRELFIELARAWYGAIEPSSPIAVATEHRH